MAWLGILLGIAFGAVAASRHFCLHGSLLESFTHKRINTGRLSSFFIAMACSVLLVQGIQSLLPLRLEQSIYLSTRLNIVVLVMGGFLFGIGMMLAQGCISRQIIKLASGNLMSLPILLLVGMFAFAAIAGVFAVPLNWLQEHTRITLTVPQSAAALITHYTDLSPSSGKMVAVSMYTFPLLICAYLFRKNGQPLTSYWDGVAMSLIIACGWVVTTLGYDEFDDVPLAAQSLTFTLSTGRSMQFFMLSTSYAFEFTIAMVCGAFLGAFLFNLFSKRLQLTIFNEPKETWHAFVGGCLMGIGGVMALGCNVGQGLSGFSTLSVGSVIALTSILAGSACVIVIRDRRPPLIRAEPTL